MPNLAAHPVRKPPQPRYPTRLDVRNDPGLLADHIPAAWLGRSELAGALGLMLALNSSGCTSDSPNRSQAQKQAAETQLAVSTLPQAQRLAIVAPLFEHGEGYGSSGCVVITPPAFLSEEEAVQTISECLRQNGINLTPTKLPAPKVSVPTWSEKLVRTKDETTGQERSHFQFTEHPEQVKPLVPDLESADHRILIEFVSYSDERDLKFDPLLLKDSELLAAVSEMTWSSVSHYRPKELADHIRQTIQKQGKDIVFGAFYDPATIMRPVKKDPKEEIDWPALNSKATAESKRLLRLQVQDFVNWLKAQGAM